jgi:hypothetical protein
VPRRGDRIGLSAKNVAGRSGKKAPQGSQIEGKNYGRKRAQKTQKKIPAKGKSIQREKLVIFASFAFFCGY